MELNVLLVLMLILLLWLAKLLVLIVPLCLVIHPLIYVYIYVHHLLIITCKMDIALLVAQVVNLQIGKPTELVSQHVHHLLYLYTEQQLIDVLQLYNVGHLFQLLQTTILDIVDLVQVHCHLVTH